MTQRKQIGIWLRVSTEDQVKGESLEIHEHRAKAFAESRDWNVCEVYRLEAVSGKRVIDHPEAKRMIDDVKSGKISALIFSKLARLSRNNRELLEFADIFKEAGADLVSLAESIDTGSPAGRMFYNMLAAMANWEREEIASRIAASVPIRAKLGKPLGGPAPFGYAWHNKGLVVNKDEAPIRILIHELYQKHRRCGQVARLLNDMGQRTRKGARWSVPSIERLLRDSSAKGSKRSNFTRASPDSLSWEYKPESDWAYVSVEPLISEELFDQCLGYLGAQRTRGKRMSRTTSHLFMGQAYCACGQKLHVPSKSRKYVCNACKNRIPAETLEDCFMSELTSFVFSQEEMKRQRRSSQSRINDLDGLIKSQCESLAKIEHKIDTLIDLYENQAIDQSAFKSRYQEHGQLKRELEQELPRLIAQQEAIAQSLQNSDLALKEAVNLAERWPDLPNDDKRIIVETILERVVVGQMEIEFTFLFSSNPPSEHKTPPRTPTQSDSNKVMQP